MSIECAVCGGIDRHRDQCSQGPDGSLIAFAPIPPTICPTCDREYADPLGLLCSNSFHIGAFLEVTPAQIEDAIAKGRQDLELLERGRGGILPPRLPPPMKSHRAIVETKWRARIVDPETRDGPWEDAYGRTAREAAHALADTYASIELVAFPIRIELKDGEKVRRFLVTETRQIAITEYFGAWK